MKPPSDVTVLSVIEPCELRPLPLLLLDALDMLGGAGADKATAAMDSSKLGLLDEGRMVIEAGWRSPVREPGGEYFELVKFVVDADERCRRVGGGE